MAEYIEREALIERLKFKRDNASKYPNLTYYGLESAIAQVRKATAADVVEVVHGRWVPVPSSDMATGKAYTCSECEKMRFGSFKPNYCSNCGARMDGE